MKNMEATKTLTIRATGAVVDLAEVERDDDEFVIGTTTTGKRTVIPASHIADEAKDQPEYSDDPMPTGIHRFRIYRKIGDVLPVVQPGYGDVEAWFLGEGDATLRVRVQSGYFLDVDRDEVLSIASATPEDQRAALGHSNGHTDDSVEQA